MAESAACRSWFSATAPPTRVPAGRSDRSRSIVLPDGRVGGVLPRDRLEQRQVAADRCGGHDLGDARIAARADADDGTRVGRRSDELQRPGRARAERRLHLLVADAGGVARGDDLDRRHRGVELGDRHDEHDEDRQGRGPRSGSGCRQSRSPQAAKRGERCSPEWTQGSESLSTLGPSLASTAGSRVSVAASTKRTASMIPRLIERNAGLGTSITALSEISTVSPEKSTALPAVSIVCATASSGGSFGAEEGAAEPMDDEQRVVDAERQREHQREVHRPDRDRHDLGAEVERAGGGEQADHRQHQRQAGGDQGAEGDQHDRQGHGPGDDLGAQHRALVRGVEVGPHPGGARQVNLDAVPAEGARAGPSGRRRRGPSRWRRGPRRPARSRCGRRARSRRPAGAGRRRGRPDRRAACARRRRPPSEGGIADGLRRRVDDDHQPVAGEARGSCGRSAGAPAPTASRSSPSRRLRGPSRPSARGSRARARHRPADQHDPEVGRRVAAEPADGPDLTSSDARRSDRRPSAGRRPA